ncbi:protein NO VEIN domain-containing protein [Actinomadura kijaniata]|uniref:protein NO VEIN domain-containing protein n=1 Tax=Actinomadura kijaniata TaxID=46161 RepID=UPI003F1BF490
MRATTDDGQLLDAEYAVETEAGSRYLALVLESSSGTRGATGRLPRNVDYRPALKLLLSRLKDRNAVLVDGLVDSRVTASLPEDDRRLFASPIVLADEHDLEALRRRLCTVQSSIGQAPGATKGGNATKRIRLRLAIPGYTPADASRLATELAQPTPAAAPPSTLFTPPETPVNQWWVGDPAERFWMEITNRPDVGSNLRALQRNGTGGEYWSYSLVTAVRPGDIVLHWHKNLHGRPGIVGYSTAVDGPYDDRLLWDARGTYGRRRPANTQPQPAWRYELTGYTPLTEPIGQQTFHPLEARLRQIRHQLEERIDGPLYFPFVFSDTRPLRAAQAYLVKMPAAIVNLVPALAEAAGLTPHATRSDTASVRPRQRSRRLTGAGYVADPVLRKAIEDHAVRRARALYPDHAITDVGATHSYDLHAVKGDEEIHIEVKGSTGTADTVELTANEVTHARTARTDLVVVDQITWERTPDGTITTSGGRCRHWTDWEPDQQDLQPTRYRYTLPRVPG